MIHGLYLDPRCYNIDLIPNKYWSPEQYGVTIDLHPDAFNIPKRGIDKKYQFVIASEVWEKSIQKSLHYMRNEGLKVFLLAREPIKYGTLIPAMFSYERFKYKGEYYFTPDLVLASGKKYADLWARKAPTIITGYPRFEQYISLKRQVTKKSICEEFGLEFKKDLIFFSDFPPYHYKKVGEKDSMVDLYEAREQMVQALIKYARRNTAQVVIKLHPMSMKPFLKKTGVGNEVSGSLLEYYKNPDKICKVIGDNRMDGQIAKKLLIGCDLCVGYNSTMMLEASILKKPVIQARFGACEEISNPCNGVFETAYEQEGLVKLLKHFKDCPNDFISRYGQSVAEGFFYKIDGKCCERVCDAIKKTCDGQPVCSIPKTEDKLKPKKDPEPEKRPRRKRITKKRGSR